MRRRSALGAEWWHIWRSRPQPHVGVSGVGVAAEIALRHLALAFLHGHYQSCFDPRLRRLRIDVVALKGWYLRMRRYTTMKI